MASIDERVVAMSFENGKFEQGVAQSMATLNKLEASLANVGKTSGLSNIAAEANKINFGGLSGAIEGVGRSFSVLGGAAAVALGGIVASAVSAGVAITKALTLGPISEGFHNYETQINAVQTILANTGLTGQQGIDKVNASLSVLNDYANKTIFNFGEMAKNIGTFTAAGVGLEQATASIKGIANLAALSGSNSQQASTAMYQLSQAIAAGTVHLQDWNSVVNAGMGGEVFQKALFNTGKAMGTLTNVPVGQTFEEWKKAGNSFRQSLSTTAKQGTKDVDAVKVAQKDAAKTIADVNKSAADSIEQSARRVKEAQQGQAEAAKQGAEDVANAVKSQQDTVKQAAADVKSALDGVRDARKRLAEAMKPASADALQAATDNLTSSQLDQADTATAITDAQTEQKRAAEDLATAQAKLAAVQRDPKATANDLQQAQRGVEDATKRVADAADAQTRALLKQNAATRDVDQAEKDLNETRKQGTKNDQNVKDARDALTVATQKYKDAQKKQTEDVAKAAQHVRDVQVKAAEQTAKAGQRLADAETAQADTIKAAQEKIADAHVAAKEKINAARKSLDTAAPKSWLTSDVLTATLQQFTGDMSDAQLKAKGFSDAQIKNIQATAKVAVESATKIKTFSQLTQALREEVGSAWANVFKTVFGNITEAKSVFTEFHTFAQNALTGPVIAFNKVLQGWAKLGGRVIFIDALKSGFKGLMTIIKPVHDAFREIFPAQTAASLLELTKKFKALMDSLRVGPETAAKLKDTFAGFFAVLHIGWTIVKDVVKVIADLLGVAGKGSGGFLSITAAVGRFLVKLDKAISTGDGFKSFLKGLESVLKVPIELIGKLAHAIGSMFGGDQAGKAKVVSDNLGQVGDALSPLAGIIKTVTDAWDKLVGLFDRIIPRVQAVISDISGVITSFVQTVAAGFQNANFDSVFSALNTGLIAGIFLIVRNAFKGGVGVDLGGGLLGNLSKSFKALTGNLEAMQQNIKANTLLQIGSAVLVLAGGVKILSTINGDDLQRSMSAIAVGLGELVAAMAILSTTARGGGFAQMPFIAGSMVLLATAVTILAGAMKIMATMSWDELIKGLAGLAGSLVAIGGATKLMSGPQLILVGPALIAIGVGLNIIAGAMKIMATMSWGDMAKGLAGVAGALVAISIGVSGMGPEVLLIGPGLVILAIALAGIAGAVKLFGSMDLATLAKGIGGIAVALVAIGLAMTAMPIDLPLTAAGLVLLAPALAGIAGVIAVLGNMDITTMAKGITAIGLSLGVLAIGLTAMIGGLPGAAALAVAAVGLNALVPALGLMGKMKWSTILKGLAGMAVSMIGISIAGALAAPGLLLLSAVLVPFGLGLELVASAAYLFAKALKLAGDDSAKSVAGIVLGLTAFVAALPKIVTDFLKGLVQIADSIATVAPKILTAIGVMLDQIIAFVIEASPKLAVAITALITAIIDVINANAGPIIQAGFQLLVHLLEGIAQNTPAVITQMGAIAIAILTSLAAMAPDLVNAGVTALTSFLSGITNNMPKLVTTVANMIVAFAKAVGSKLPQVISAGADLMVKFIGAIAAAVPKLIAGGVNAILAFFTGLAQQIPKVANKGVELVGKLLEGISKALVHIVNKGADAVINFLNGIAAAIRTKGPELRAAGYNIAGAIIDGMWQGIEELGQKIVDKLGALIHLLPKAAKKILGIQSPSTVFKEIGANTMLGFSSGIQDGTDGVVKTVTSSTGEITKAAADGLNKVPEFLYKMTDINPVITPVLDLTRIEEDSKKIGPMVGSGSTLDISPVGQESTKQASALSFETAQSDPWGVSAASANDWIAKHPTVQFVQHNTSPKALTAAEIYRLTHNQLASAKGRLFGKADNIR